MKNVTSKGTNKETYECFDTINDRIKEIRLNNKMTISTVSKLLGYSVDLIKKIESGKRNVTTDHVIDYCNYFKVPSDYILFRKKNKSTKEQLAEQIAELPIHDQLELTKSIIDRLYKLQSNSD